MVPTDQRPADRRALPALASIETWLRRSNVVTGLLATALVHLVGFAFLTPFFASNDDGVMSLIAKGGWKETVNPSEFLLFINVLVGLLLKRLYLLLPGFHWYATFMFAVFFAATWATLTSLLAVRRSRSHKILLSLVFVPVFYQYFTHLHFTIVSFWAGQAALFLLIGRSEGPRRRSTYFVAGALLLVSSLLRFDGMGLVLAMALPSLLLTWRRAIHREKQHLIALAVVVSVVVAGAQLLHRRYYQSRPAWSQVMPALAVSANLIEYRAAANLADLPNKLAAVGWSPLDFQLLSFRIWQDPKFNLDDMRKLDQSLGPVFGGKKLLLYPVVRDRYVRLLVLLVFLSAFFLPGPGYRRALFGLLWALLLLGTLFTFKKVTVWVTWPLFSYAALVGFVDPEQPSSAGRPFGISARAFAWAQRLALILAGAVSVYSLARITLENRVMLGKESAMVSDLRALGPKADQLYLVSSMDDGFPLETISVFGNYDLFQHFPAHRLSWEQMAPREQELLRRFHVDDLVTDVADRSDVFIIASPRIQALYTQYAWERHRTRLAFRSVFAGRSFKVDRITTVPAEAP